MTSETATIVEVSFLPNESALSHVRYLFATAQQSVGGDWTHIEVSTFEAGHCRLENFRPSGE